jgi:hypothetical protein
MLEQELTVGLALQFGYQNVKGSKFVSDHKIDQLKDFCCAVTDRCYACFEKGKKANKHSGCKKEVNLPGTIDRLILKSDVHILSAIFCQ